MKKIILLLFCFCVSTGWAQQENFTIKNISANNKFEDFGVAYFGDSIAVFASSGHSVFMKRVWSGNHEPFLSLFQGTLSDDGEIKNIKPFGKRLDTKYHESNLIFTNLKNTNHKRLLNFNFLNSTYYSTF